MKHRIARACKRRISGILFLLLMFFGLPLFSQDDSGASHLHFNGNVNVTTNGFSFIPTFTLGKPATIVNLSVGGNRFNFDPQFRFDLDGLKPWSLIFIWRYTLVHNERFIMKLGTHLPALSFKTQTIEVDGELKDQVYVQRFLVPELTINYALSEHVNVGTYYIYGLGLEKKDQARNSHFLSLRSTIHDIRLFGEFLLKWHPEVYYLRLDGTDGFYAAHTVSVSLAKLPLTLSSTMNKALRSDINTKDFQWNISLAYVFSTQLEKR